MSSATARLRLAICILLIIMAAVSTVLFALAPVATWSTFANLCSPVLVALMFVVEAGCRRFALPGVAHAGVREAIQGYRAAMAARAGLSR